MSSSSPDRWGGWAITQAPLKDGGMVTVGSDKYGMLAIETPADDVTKAGALIATVEHMENRQ